MQKLFFFIVFVCASICAEAQTAAQWYRYPAISPDGQTVLFSYKGDIYSVPASGGNATALTLSDSYEFAPVWSHDGKSIAFASDRHGNFDVFVMPATGGDARRLTFHSTREVPSTFSPNDQAVLFTAYRQDAVTNAQFPLGLLSELYSVPVTGGQVKQVLTTPAIDATFSHSGNMLIYHDIKGYEDMWRKHHTSSIARDVWSYDLNKKTYTQLTTYVGEDRNPVFDANDNDYYYLSEQSGSFNVYKSSVNNPSNSVQITKFAQHPVRFLTRANNGTLCFGYDGDIYTLAPGAAPQKVNIRVAADGRSNIDKNVPISDGFTEATLSPNGKEFAYVFRGEIFVSSVEGGITKRITNTPYQERSVSFSPDGRKILYAAEKDNNWNVYTSSIVRSEEPYFYASTVLKEEPVVATKAEEFQPLFSPDGKEVAYLQDRVNLMVMNLATKTSRLVLNGNVNYSYADGDQWYQWSPDSKWFLVSFGLPDRIFTSEVGLIASDGKGELQNLTLSGYDDVRPKWMLEGKAMIWGSTRDGLLGQNGNSSTLDVNALFFSKAAYDRFNLSKEELALVKEREDKDKKDKDKDKDKEDKADKKTTDAKAKPAAKDSVKKDIVIDFKNLTDRKKKLTTHTSDANDWVLSKDGEKLFYLTTFEKANDLWVTDNRTHDTKLLAKIGARSVAMELSSDGKFIFVLADGKVSKIDAESGKSEALAARSEMVLKAADERNYIFEHSWRQFKEKFYLVDNFHGADWNFYHDAYKKFLPSINNNYDFAELLSEMLGEVNASHTGCRYRYTPPNSDETANLGVFFDYNYAGPGLRIAEVIEEGPLDKAASKVKTGDILEKIDGIAITDSIDFYVLLNRKTDKLTLLSLYDPNTKTRWEETTKPISGGTENELLYKRWVKNRRNEVDKLSGGKIGYIHVRSMNDASMRTVVEEALGRHITKDAIIVDTRFNGGGNIHEQLSDFLSGKRYVDVIPHGQLVGHEPGDKWIKPSIVLMGESNYSDAHLFPMAYKAKNLGKTLGMPVPGTGTFVWWETQIDPTLVFGIPMGGWKMPDGRFCENTQMEPDVKVRNEHTVLSNGRDEQIEAAVKELMKK